MLDYALRVILGDLFLYVAGIFSGVIVTVYLLTVHLKDVYIIPETKNTRANLIRHIDDDGKKVLYVNPKSTSQTIEMIWQYCLWKMRKKKYDGHIYALSHEARAKKSLYFFITFASIWIIIALILIFTVQT